MVRQKLCQNYLLERWYNIRPSRLEIRGSKNKSLCKTKTCSIHNLVSCFWTTLLALSYVTGQGRQYQYSRIKLDYESTWNNNRQYTYTSFWRIFRYFLILFKKFIPLSKTIFSSICRQDYKFLFTHIVFTYTYICVSLNDWQFRA